MKSGKVFAFAFLIGAVLLSTQCPSTPDGGNGSSSAYTTYTDTTYGFSFEYPKDWIIIGEESGIVMIMSNDLSGSAMITAGVEEKGEYSYDNPYDLVDGMMEGYTSGMSIDAQVDGPYQTSAAGHTAAEGFVQYTVQTGEVSMEVKYTFLSIDQGDVFYNIILTECLSSVCTQYPGVYDHIKSSFGVGSTGSSGESEDSGDSEDWDWY